MSNKTYLLYILLFILGSCNSYKYIHDTSSAQRQRELQKNRSGNVISEIFMAIGSVILEASTGYDMFYIPQEQDFKRIKIKNPTNDTMYINMVTDAVWDNQDYCDFMDIRIPPEEKCRILVPINVNYNIYFGNTDNPENDEFIGVNTLQLRKIVLNPGITIKSDTLNIP